MSDRQQLLQYILFWRRVGQEFPSLKGAASTDYYFECERLLFERFFPPLEGRSLFKTDLWDEAKNTEVLAWATRRGARPFGIDISCEIIQQAKSAMPEGQLGSAQADIRALPFIADAFDLVYSMGTIEHFPDYAAAVAEIFRVLKPGGTAIVGVPNKADPFLRPVLVDLLNRVGLYQYGMEKSFTAGQLCRLLEAAGFEAQALTGILFVPGWLRMLDLLLYTRCRPLAPVSGLLLFPFRRLYRHVPAVRRHGYLIACVATKPCAGAASGHREQAGGEHRREQ